MFARHRSFLCEPRLASIRPWMWVAAGGFFGLALALDGAILRSLSAPREHLSDMQRLLRVGGYLPTWLILIVATVLASNGARRRVWAMTAGSYVIVSAALAGGLSALLKIIVRRPDLDFGDVYSGWHTAPFGADPLDGTDYSFPSEHAAVAFGATLMLCRLYPRATPVLLAFGFGTAAIRVRQWGHHPSDTMGSLLVALAVVACVPLLMRRLLRLLRAPGAALAVAPAGAPADTSAITPEGVSGTE